MLKHMTPGPSSGQPRPPTRGLPHPHTQQQQQQQQQSSQTQTTTNGRPQPPQPPQTTSSTTNQQQQQQQTIIQPLNVSNLSTPTIALTIPPKLIANGGLRHSALLNSTPITLTNNNNNSNNNNNNNCNIKQNNNNNSNNCNNNNNQQYNHNLTNLTNGTCNYTTNSTILNTKTRIGAREALTSLGLLCLVSLLLALLSLIFLLKISPGGRELPPPPPGPTSPEDYIIVYDVTLALCALSLSLNLCCLLVCAIQFLFAVKLVRAPATTGRGNKYLEKSSVSRVCAVGGFFISIPIFLTGIILYTFTQFHSTPAIITSVLIGIGIVFCGGAMVHNVFVWQKEKTICVRNQPLQLQISPQISAIAPPIQFSNQNQLNTNDLNQTTTTTTLNNNNNTNCNNMLMNPQSIGLSQIHLNLQHHHGINNHQANHTPLTHTSQHSHATSLTPISPNHSHNNISFNHSYVPGYVVRAATATPPTPKINSINGGRCDGTIDGGGGRGGGRGGGGGGGSGGNNNSRGIIPPPPTLNDGQTTRDASGSISPGMPTNLEISNVTSTSPHELSTLV